jgi:hypothetical protein
VYGAPGADIDVIVVEAVEIAGVQQVIDIELQAEVGSQGRIAPGPKTW